VMREGENTPSVYRSYKNKLINFVKGSVWVK